MGEESYDQVMGTNFKAPVFLMQEVAYILKTRAKLIQDFSKVEKVEYNRFYLESITLNLLSNAF